ncbi:MAG: TIR domain-containing protein, partial [Planctomycetota bacterium]|nr:TIR domain-containing protein [Planctomycetota bacterium]
MSESQYHTFLSHNGVDTPAVEEVAERLQKEGINCWLDRWNLIPGEPWQDAIEKALQQCDSCCVFIGPSGVGPWQNEEMRAAIDRRVKDSRFRVVPIVLPGGQREQRGRLPSFLVEHTWVEFHDSLDEEDAFHRLRCGILGIQPGTRPGVVIDADACPYPGLQTFQVEEAPLFFGRQVEVEWLLDKLRTNFNTPQENRFLAIVGASGSGKSSLARAGLLAAMSQRQLPESNHWPLIICRPGYDPLKQLALALWHHPQIREAAGDYGELIERLASQPERLHLTIDAALYGRPEEHRVVLLIDQFEEIFTLCDDEERRHALIDNLLEATRVRGGRTLVVITLRADFYGRCGAFPRLAAVLSDHQELVGPMQPKHLQQAIECPAQLAGCELEPGLTEMLLEGMENQPGGLPLLQHALRQLWLRRSGRRLTVAAYRNIGRLEGALDRHANELFEHLSDEQRDICRR